MKSFVVFAAWSACALATLAGAEAEPEPASEQPAEAAPTPPPPNPADVIAWLFQQPPDKARVEMRLTSVDSAGRKKVAELSLRYSREGDEPALAVALADQKLPVHDFCFRCGQTRMLVACLPAEGSFPASEDEMIPGTLLPWRALTLGFCREIVVRSTEASEDKQYDIVIVAPSGAAETDTTEVMRVFVSHATQFPEKIVQLDAEGAPRSTLEIHQVRRVPWGRAVTRSTWIDTKSKARTLIEMRSSEVGDAPKPDSEKP